MISKKLKRICSMTAAVAFTITTFSNFPALQKDSNYQKVEAVSTSKVEFEDGTYGADSAFGSSIAGFSGTGYVDQQEGDVSVTVNVDATDIYELTIGYCLPSDRGSKIQDLYINGVSQGQVSFASSDTFTELKVSSIKLTKGENTITLKKSWGWTIFDYLKINTAVLPEVAAGKTLSDPSATDSAKSLMSYLVDQYGNHIISGQQEYYGESRDDEFEYIYNLSGEYPAIRGFDFGETCPLYAWDAGAADRAISWVKDKGGIVTASWHINVPVTMANYTLGSTMSFDQTTYSQKTDFKTANVMVEGTVEHDYFLLAVDNLAKELKKLQTADVPLLFRPFHEAEGGGGEDGKGAWFWWGKEGAEVYKDLYAYLYNILTQEYGLHNLIWEFNSYAYEKSESWYPGDQYVDIVGYDKYNATNWTTNTVSPNESAIASTFYSLVNWYGGNDGKPVAMMENDTIPTVENLTSEKAAWLYFCPWYGDHLMNSNYNKPDSVKEMYQSDYCITLDELPDNLYGSSTSGSETTTTTTTPAVTTPEQPSDGRYEFESGTLVNTGGSAVTSDAAASGGKFVYLKDAGDSVSVDINAQEAGTYKIIFGYSQSFDPSKKIQDLYINGTLAENVTFTYSDKFTETSGTVISLKKGTNTIKIVSSWGWTYLDYFKIVKAETVKVDATGATLSNPKASDAAKSLYSYICNNYGSKIISGQQESTWMGSPDYEMNFINDASGKYPALRGLDYMNDDFSGVNARAKEWYEKGGIVSICWHCGSGFSKGYDECKADDLDWDKALTPGTDEYNALIKGMDSGAQALTVLKSEGIPVLWRPFHEFDGGWFWWSKGGAENFKKLWQLMYDRYTNYWGLDNLIWVCGFTSGVPESWYPGDEYVDIAGADTYVDNNASLVGMFNKVLDVVGTNKPVVLHENGPIPDPDNLQADSAAWGWFMTWHTEYITQQNSVENIKKVYNSDYVITLDELPEDLYTSQGTPTQEIVYGDLNDDKIVEMTDLTILSLYLLGDVKLNAQQIKAADVSGDGNVDLADLSHFKQYILKEPVTLGPQK
ncbi:MAG: glycosyl hydrolase [Oscillospiraceae bacterium]|nr:glycosyl hydrolase [Oscillospiraceae bacterium]